MLLPIGDTPNPPITPYVNYLLIAANVLVYLFVTLPLSFVRPELSDPALIEYLRAFGFRGTLSLQSILESVTAYDLFVFAHGFRPAEPSASTLFQAMFLHANWLHLSGNMLFLWIFGDNVEYRLGRVGYLATYLGTGVVATVFFALFVPESQIPLVGASGAVSGVLGCYYLWFPRNRVKTFVFFFPFLMDTFYIPARLVLGFYLLAENLIPFLMANGASSGVAYGAHIGGFLAGIVVAQSLMKGVGVEPSPRRAKLTRLTLNDDQGGSMSDERTGVITFKSNPMTLIGPQLAVGDAAPSFTLVDNSLSPVTLEDSKGKVRLITVVPSLDTGVCDAMTRRFNEEAASLPETVEVFTVSLDLPFAQARWCGNAGIQRVRTLSDYQLRRFGKDYGVLIKELMLLARAVFVIDASDRIAYVQIVSEVTQEPDYAAALNAVRALL